METVIRWVDLLGLEPQHVLAFWIGVVASWVLTQIVKRRVQWTGATAFMLAFIIGFIASYTSMPEFGPIEFWLSSIAAGLAPLSYKGLKHEARKRNWTTLLLILKGGDEV